MKTFESLDAAKTFEWHSEIMMGCIRIAGVAGTYRMELPGGAFTKVRFAADEGSGLSNALVANPSNGNYASPGIEARGNSTFFQQVADGVNGHAAKHRAN